VEVKSGSEEWKRRGGVEVRRGRGVEEEWKGGMEGRSGSLQVLLNNLSHRSLPPQFSISLPNP
jgi:hypothetical protein